MRISDHLGRIEAEMPVLDNWLRPGVRIISEHIIFITILLAVIVVIYIALKLLNADESVVAEIKSRAVYIVIGLFVILSAPLIRDVVLGIFDQAPPPVQPTEWNIPGTPGFVPRPPFWPSHLPWPPESPPEE